MILLFSLLLSGLAISGSADRDELWDTRNISVCFAGAEATPRKFSRDLEVKVDNWPGGKKKALVRWLKEEYTAEKTIISFTGFKSCAETPDADVPVFYGKKSSIRRFFEGGIDGFAKIGQGIRAGSLEGFPGARSYVWLSSAGFSRATAIHEFGHVTGLLHEHDRDEAREDKKCDPDRHIMLGFIYSREMITPYDSDSVMSYCTIYGKGGKKRGLSAGDQETLKLLYR